MQVAVARGPVRDLGGERRRAPRGTGRRSRSAAAPPKVKGGANRSPSGPLHPAPAGTLATRLALTGRGQLPWRGAARRTGRPCRAVLLREMRRGGSWGDARTDEVGRVALKAACCVG